MSFLQSMGDAFTNEMAAVLNEERDEDLSRPSTIKSTKNNKP